MKRLNGLELFLMAVCLASLIPFSHKAAYGFLAGPRCHVADEFCSTFQHCCSGLNCNAKTHLCEEPPAAPPPLPPQTQACSADQDCNVEAGWRCNYATGQCAMPPTCEIRVFEIAPGDWSMDWKTTNATSATVSDGSKIISTSLNGFMLLNDWGPHTYTIIATSPIGNCIDSAAKH